MAKIHLTREVFRADHPSDWMRHLLARSRYPLTGVEIFQAFEFEFTFVELQFPKHFSKRLGHAIRSCCRRGDIIAKARRHGAVTFEIISPEDWAYLDIELQNCGRSPVDPCGLSILGCDHHEKRYHDGKPVLAYPTGRLLRERLPLPFEVTVEWDLAVYTWAGSAIAKDAAPQPREFVRGVAPGLQEAIDKVMRETGRPGRGGIRWAVFDSKVWEACAVAPAAPGYSSRTIRTVVNTLANSQKSIDKSAD